MQMQIVVKVYLALLRVVAPTIGGMILLRCGLPLLTFQRKAEIWGWLEGEDGVFLPITHWENVLGRSRHCDIVLDFPTVSRNHGVLTRYDDGSWTVCDTSSKTGIQVNGEDVSIACLSDGDLLHIGGVPLVFHVAVSIEAEGEKSNARIWRGLGDLVLLTLFQILVCVGLLFFGKLSQPILFSFGGLMGLQWMLLLFYCAIGRASFQLEALAFFLCTLGMAVLSVVAPGEMIKQLVAICLGVGLFLLVGWSLRDLARAKAIRYLAAVTGIALLVLTLLFGETYYGAKNWLIIGGISTQPSELAKICFVFVGASGVDRLMQRRNLILFIAYTVALCGLLALMNDFGTALVFFCAFLMIAYLRSGSLGTVTLACMALLFAAMIGLKLAPHALRRLQTWRQIWLDPWGAGYQQTQSLMAIATGGLFGLGFGQGRMKNLFAADSDMVFASLCEEWGLVMGLLAVSCVLVLALFSLRCCFSARSSFYIIGSCTASAILLVQMALNVLGTVDVLPLTGVTFPFLSNGGSSMVGVWGLLAFLKGADNRKNGSFAVRSWNRGE